MDKDGSFDASPPPVGGLGNFKGVMLCNRPVDSGPGAQPGGGGVSGDGTALPFRSMAASTHGLSEQVGLTPSRNFEPTVKKRGPSAALRRHVKWLKELQLQMKDERDQVEAEDVDAEEREQKMKVAFHRHRDGVRQMIQERDAADEAEERVLKEEKSAERQAARANDPKRKAQAAPAKPLWAMSEKEKDVFEEGEADELINFAENLDYEKFIADIDFREGLGALKDRAGKLKREQDAFKDALIRDFNQQAEDEERSTSAGGSPRALEGVDGQSVLGDLRSEYSHGSRRSLRDEREGGAERGEQWDSSTNAGDDRKHFGREVREQAEEVLEYNPQMRGIHSKDSVQRIIEKARAKEAAEPPPKDLQEMMLREGPAPVPVISASSDTQNRLHKPVDPSSLPYLYRSPAI